MEVDYELVEKLLKQMSDCADRIRELNNSIPDYSEHKAFTTH